MPTHDLFVALAVLVTAAMVLWESRRRGRADRTMVVISAGALFGAGVGARLGTVVRYLAEADHPTWTGVLLDSGKTVVGGLAGAYIGVLVTKRLIGYREPTGDVFAAAAALGIAVGRIGCLLTEPPGTSTSVPWAVTWNGEQRHPSFLYEIGFLLVLFVVLLALRRPLAGAPGRAVHRVPRGVRHLPVRRRVRPGERRAGPRSDPSTVVPAARHSVRGAPRLAGLAPAPTVDVHDGLCRRPTGGAP